MSMPELILYLHLSDDGLWVTTLWHYKICLLLLLVLLLLLLLCQAFNAHIFARTCPIYSWIDSQM